MEGEKGEGIMMVGSKRKRRSRAASARLIGSLSPSL
jgi:hypothetical protein